MNPLACGVAKFNHALAKRLGVPIYSMIEPYYAARTFHPLYSIKTSEMPPRTQWVSHDDQYDVFYHDWDDASIHRHLATNASRVFAASTPIADSIRPHRPDVITAFCPSTIEGNPDRGGYRVLTFGMSHKLVLPHFEQLKRELERDHPDYTISLSTAVHEGNPWDEALATSVEAMRGIFGNRLRVLGFLADDALAKEIQDCDAVAAFFVPALRANNTSAWAALSAGKFLYTNLDSQSPTLDPEQYGWDALLKVLA